MRYIGSKLKLLSFIEKFLKDKNIMINNYTFFDAFSGMGSVGDYFKNTFNIIANDIQYYSYVITKAKLNKPNMKFESLGFDPFEYFNNSDGLEGFIWSNYSPGNSERKYFTEENAKLIDFIRTTIEEWYKNNKINEDEYYYLIACLLESVSKVSNIAGVYGSFLRNWDPRAIKRMKFINIETFDNNSIGNNIVYNKSLESIIETVSGDILYLDPPYTANQYSVQYHLLETIAKYDNPIITGKGGLRNTSETASLFSKKNAVEIVFDELISKSKFKYIILSYSSDGIMSEKYIESVFKRYGKPETFEKVKINYRSYQNHKTNENKELNEYLFFIEKNDNTQYASPLNYQGGKHDLITFIKDNLPKEPINTFVDLFGGGYNVGINIEANNHIYNDCNFKVKELIEMFKDEDTLSLIQTLNKIIKKYNLSASNKESFLKLREYYNSLSIKDRKPIILYALIMYGFNQQIRFNSSYDYNNTIGMACFNDVVLEKLISFSRTIKNQNITLLSKNFEDVEITDNSFVYCDPPYLITLGSYNDGKRGFNGWTKDDEIRLYSFLDTLNSRGIKFMLSNVIEHKGKTNDFLIDWVNKMGYNIIHNTQITRGNRAEVLITNY